MFNGLTEKFQDIFSKFSSKKVFTEENLKDAVKKVRLALLDADVNYKIASSLVKRIKESWKTTPALQKHKTYMKIPPGGPRALQAQWPQPAQCPLWLAHRPGAAPQWPVRALHAAQAVGGPAWCR